MSSNQTTLRTITWQGEMMAQWNSSIDRMGRAFSPHDFAAARFLGRWPALGWHRACGAQQFPHVHGFHAGGADRL